MLKLGAEGKVIRQMGFLLAVLMGVLPMSAVADYSSHPSAAALADRVFFRCTNIHNYFLDIFVKREGWIL